MTDPFQHLPDALLALRRRRSLSQREVADRTGLALSSVASYERGERSPTVSSLGTWMSGVGVTLDELFEVLCELRGEPPRLAELRSAGADPRGSEKRPSAPQAFSAEDVATLKRVAWIFRGMLAGGAEGELAAPASRDLREAPDGGSEDPPEQGAALKN